MDSLLQGNDTYGYVHCDFLKNRNPLLVCRFPPTSQAGHMFNGNDAQSFMFPKSNNEFHRSIIEDDHLYNDDKTPVRVIAAEAVIH